MAAVLAAGVSGSKPDLRWGLARDYHILRLRLPRIWQVFTWGLLPRQPLTGRRAQIPFSPGVSRPDLSRLLLPLSYGPEFLDNER